MGQMDTPEVSDAKKARGWTLWMFHWKLANHIFSETVNVQEESKLSAVWKEIIQSTSCQISNVYQGRV